jgi:predicted nucleotidyltransferase
MVKRSSINLIKVLIENRDKELNISDVAQYSKVNYKNTYLTVKFLEEEGLITIQSFGKNKRVILNKKIHPLIFESEFERRSEFLKNKDFLVLTKKFEELNFPFIILVFGSYAKATSKKGSDIDLLIICENKREEEIQSIIDLFPLKIHPTFFNFEEFIKMSKTKEFNVVAEAIKKNIILMGIEDYYRIIENVK